jgi:hypothetical protein
MTVRHWTSRGWWVACVVAMWLAGPGEALARAGGGGGHGRGSLLIKLVLLPVMLAYAAFVSYLVRKRGREAQDALAKARVDPVWNPDAIRRRVEQVFFKVQDAWTKRDQDIARDCMSAGLHASHKLQTDAMIQAGTRNVLQCINLSGTTIVQVADYSDDRRDQFWAYIEGSMLDYTVNERTQAVIKGDNGKPESFSELWKFVREGDTWVLDRIEQHTLTELLRLRSMTEAVARPRNHATSATGETVP